MKKPWRHWFILVGAGSLLGYWLVSAFNLAPLAQPVFRQTNQWVEQVRTQDWMAAHSEHFLLSYTAQDAGQTELILAEAEKVYESFQRGLGFDPVELEGSAGVRTIPIVLYHDTTSMQERFHWSASEAATGAYFGGVIYLLSPTAWLYGPALEEQEARQLYHKKGPFYHEYTHFFLDNTANNNFPRWYTEGLAQWVEYEAIGYEWLSMENNLKQSELYSLSEMDRSFDQVENQALMYRQSFQFLAFMIQRHGQEVVKELHEELAKRIPFSKSWQNVFGEPVEASFEHWKQEVKKT